MAICSSRKRIIAFTPAARARVFPCALVGLLMWSAGCESGPKFVSRTEVANQIMEKTWGPMGTKSESATCPHDLQPAVGAKVKCAMTLEGRLLDVEVTVIGIDDGNVNLDMRAVGRNETSTR